MPTLRVLVVDDELGMRLGVTRALDGLRMRVEDIEEEVQLEVVAAEDGERGLELVAADPPDLLLLDHKLPGLSGLEVLDRLPEVEADLLTVMVTAYASLETAVSATRKGAFDFLAKPFTPAELKLTVNKATRHLLLRRQALRLQREKHQVRFQFLSVLAHELKSPVAAVEGYLNLMQDRVLGDELASYEMPLRRSLARLSGMRKMITDLLDLTRIESGQRRRELVKLDLREVAEGALEGVALAAASRSITLALEAPPTVDLLADQQEMEIVLNNLVSNAVKYNRDGGRVEVRLLPGADELTVEVEDTGIGLAPEQAARLFGEFVRIKSPKTSRIEGSGLGLSIVKKIAALYAGQAQVRSELGEGSVFSVTLHPGETA